MDVARATAARGRPIWLVNLSRWETHEATTMVEAALLRETSCRPREPLKGAFFDAVLRCDATPGEAAHRRVR